MNVESAFPVSSSTACLLKWGWSTLLLYNGTSNSCHRCSLSYFEPDQVGSFHNTAEKIRQRQLMQNGEWPERGNGCEYCKDIESSGGMSDRLTNLKMLGIDTDYKKLIPPELLTDPAALNVTPTMLEVYFTNRCNMACIYCGPNFSTKWVVENEHHGVLDHHTNSVNAEKARILDSQYEERLRNFWIWLEGHYTHLKIFNILGGEPFYQQETEDTIRFFYDHPNPEMNLKITSNLKVGKEKFRYLIKELKKLYTGKKCKSVGIIASMDCWGKEVEYVRSGLNLKDWLENYEYLVYHNPWATVSINSTINALSVRAMPDLLRNFGQWQEKRTRINSYMTDIPDISIVFNLLQGPRFMNAGIFPQGFFDEEFKEIISLLPNRNHWEKANIDYMHGIWKSVDSAPHNPALVQSLKLFLDEIDRRRKTNWRETFPWLVDTN
jgi:hypothetical protein